MKVKHSFTSAIPDGGDAALVRPSDWNAEHAITNEYLHVRDEKANGVSGGGSVAGLQTRTLNTVSANTITGASLSGSQITLPAGTYRCLISAPVYVPGSHKLHLYNVTDSQNAITGTSEYAASGGGNGYNRSFVMGQFLIAAQKVFDVRHYIQIGQPTNGLGLAVSDGNVEVYAVAEFWKIG